MDKTFSICSPEKIDYFNFDLERINPPYLKVEAKIEESQLGDYDHFMLKEIYEQPKIIKIANNYLENNEIKIDHQIIKDIEESDKIYLLAQEPRCMPQ